MTQRQENARAPRPALALLAAAPYLVLQLIFLSDIQGWSEALAYGLFLIVFPAVFVGWAILLGVEIVKRRRLPAGRCRTPAFALCGLCFLLSFFHVGVWLRPLVLSVPRWCHVMQKIEWSTDKPHEKYGGNHSYILMLVGRGNEKDHSFTSAYLNWTCDEPAGIPSLRFDDLTMSHETGANYSPIQLSLQTLRERMNHSGLPSRRVDDISSEIWTVTQQARSNQPVVLSDGKVDPVWTDTFGAEDTVLGGVVWALLLITTFQLMAALTLPKKEDDEAGRFLLMQPSDTPGSGWSLSPDGQKIVYFNRSLFLDEKHVSLPARPK